VGGTYYDAEFAHEPPGDPHVRLLAAGKLLNRLSPGEARQLGEALIREAGKATRATLEALAGDADDIEAALHDETAHRAKPGEVSIGDRMRRAVNGDWPH